MNSGTFEARMRALAYFHSLRVLPGAWTVIRVDGHGFSRFTATGLKKPLDPALPCTDDPDSRGVARWAGRAVRLHRER